MTPTRDAEGPPIGRPRGRQRGWRKPNAYRHFVMIRLSLDDLEWLRRESEVRMAEDGSHISVSEVVRQLIEEARRRSAGRTAGRRRPAAGRGRRGARR